jgi:exodeoxyribonuclease VII small subunit
MATSKRNKTPNFEKSLAELEKIVDRMEKGEQSLDETLRDFERGMILSEQCQKNLDEAQQKVEKLVKKHGAYKLEAVDNNEFDDEFESESNSRAKVSCIVSNLPGVNIASDVNRRFKPG